MTKPDLSLSGPVVSFRMAYPIFDDAVHPDDADRIIAHLALRPGALLEVNGRLVFAGSRYVGSIRYPNPGQASVFYFDAERGHRA